jgi:DNA-binding beta-propeller fold protein YncE
MRTKFFLLAVVLMFFASAGLAMAERHDSPGAVYTMTNSVQGNQVLVFDRSADGSLSPAGAFETFGSGTGGGLGNQGGIILTPDNQWLYVVNAGSDTISVFKVKPGDLEYVDSFYSGGKRPVSLTVDGDLLYVLNAGGAATASGRFNTAAERTEHVTCADRVQHRRQRTGGDGKGHQQD